MSDDSDDDNVLNFPKSREDWDLFRRDIEEQERASADLAGLLPSDGLTTESGAEIRIVDPLTGGEKGQKLLRYDLIPWDAMDLIAHHFGVGAAKYTDRNWERGYSWNLSYGALMRHLSAWHQGMDFDEELGTHHLAAAGFHIMALLAFFDRDIGTDDRPQP